MEQSIKSTSFSISILEMASTLFSNHSKSKRRKRQVYWVLEEVETEREVTTVKYYDDHNELVHQEALPGVKRGILDEETMQKLNQIKEQVRIQLA